ncbi:MAG: calcium/sodium antiporter [Candidatus Omnitrophica bacterium]|nr:calcium/sodium antiporter [Candidatus Omnitrophota bacterium]MBU4478334.1 calcium/sodium antiporter [Candidatus Omnitrophota bacterium]MCG2703401.1 calcium/sodium antiporter [Candidatus Omnitrophota bacterium]
MGIYKDILIFIVGALLIIRSADLFTSAAEAIALFFRIPRVIIGLTIVSIATTTPEFTVSALAAYRGSTGIAVGNVTGSCLANIGVILAAAALISPVKFDVRTVHKEMVFLIAISVLLFLLMWDGVLSFYDGLGLSCLLVAFLFQVIRREIRARKEQATADPAQPRTIKKDVVKFVIGTAGVVISAKYAIIPAGIAIAQFLHVPEIVIGISIIAIGTSLPELVTALMASAKKMGELAGGNVIGANILNILWVLGVSSMLRPLAIDVQTRMVSMPLVVGFSAAVFLFARQRFALAKQHGAALLLGYGLYLGYIVFFAYR